MGFVEPGVEICDGANDESCDGFVDEGCPCSPGASQPCYAVNPVTMGVGTCRPGVQSCVDERWDVTCIGQVTPAAEDCDGEDNDCDGTTDEGCDCVDGNVQRCYGGAVGTADVGVCRPGMQRCEGGVWSSVCEGEVLPTLEQCNGQDDDCDGSVDEGNPGGGADCTTGQPGVCEVGTVICSDGAHHCLATTGPSSESCDNGADDDCDGLADCGEDDDCDGLTAPPTQWGEDTCLCRASLPSTCDGSVPCGTCYYVAGAHYWCRKVDGVWQWHVAFDPTDPGACGGFDCTVACCEQTNAWCDAGRWEAGLPEDGVCVGYDPSYSCT